MSTSHQTDPLALHKVSLGSGGISSPKDMGQYIETGGSADLLGSPGLANNHPSVRDSEPGKLRPPQGLRGSHNLEEPRSNNHSRASEEHLISSGESSNSDSDIEEGSPTTEQPKQLGSSSFPVGSKRAPLPLGNNFRSSVMKSTASPSPLGSSPGSPKPIPTILGGDYGEMAVVEEGSDDSDEGEGDGRASLVTDGTSTSAGSSFTGRSVSSFLNTSGSQNGSPVRHGGVRTVVASRAPDSNEPGSQQSGKKITIGNDFLASYSGHGNSPQRKVAFGSATMTSTSSNNQQQQATSLNASSNGSGSALKEPCPPSGIPRPNQGSFSRQRDLVLPLSTSNLRASAPASSNGGPLESSNEHELGVTSNGSNSNNKRALMASIKASVGASYGRDGTKIRTVRKGLMSEEEAAKKELKEEQGKLIEKMAAQERLAAAVANTSLAHSHGVYLTSPTAANTSTLSPSVSHSFNTNASIGTYLGGGASSPLNNVNPPITGAVAGEGGAAVLMPFPSVQNISAVLHRHRRGSSMLSLSAKQQEALALALLSPNVNTPVDVSGAATTRSVGVLSGGTGTGSATPGLFSGNVSFANPNVSGGQYNYASTGTVSPAPQPSVSTATATPDPLGGVTINEGYSTSPSHPHLSVEDDSFAGTAAMHPTLYGQQGADREVYQLWNESLTAQDINNSSQSTPTAIFGTNTSNIVQVPAHHGSGLGPAVSVSFHHGTSFHSSAVTGSGPSYSSPLRQFTNESIMTEIDESEAVEDKELLSLFGEVQLAYSSQEGTSPTPSSEPVASTTSTSVETALHKALRVKTVLERARETFYDALLDPASKSYAKHDVPAILIGEEGLSGDACDGPYSVLQRVKLHTALQHTPVRPIVHNQFYTPSLDFMYCELARLPVRSLQQTLVAPPLPHLMAMEKAFFDKQRNEAKGSTNVTSDYDLVCDKSSSQLTIDSRSMEEDDGEMSTSTLSPSSPAKRKPSSMSLIKLRFPDFTFPSLASILVELNIGNNRLNELPADIGTFSSLKRLIAKNNRVREVPPSLCMCEDLVTLDLSNNLLEGLPEELEELNNLETLILDYNRFDHIPKCIFYGMAKLKKLCLIDNSALVRLNTIPAGGKDGVLTINHQRILSSDLDHSGTEQILLGDLKGSNGYDAPLSLGNTSNAAAEEKPDDVLARWQEVRLIPKAVVKHQAESYEAARRVLGRHVHELGRQSTSPTCAKRMQYQGTMSNGTSISSPNTMFSVPSFSGGSHTGSLSPTRRRLAEALATNRSETGDTGGLTSPLGSKACPPTVAAIPSSLLQSLLQQPLAAPLFEIELDNAPELLESYNQLRELLLMRRLEQRQRDILLNVAEDLIVERDGALPRFPAQHHTYNLLQSIPAAVDGDGSNSSLPAKYLTGVALAEMPTAAPSPTPNSESNVADPIIGSLHEDGPLPFPQLLSHHIGSTNFARKSPTPSSHLAPLPLHPRPTTPYGTSTTTSIPAPNIYPAVVGGGGSLAGSFGMAPPPIHTTSPQWATRPPARLPSIRLPTNAATAEGANHHDDHLNNTVDSSTSSTTLRHNSSKRTIAGIDRMAASALTHGELDGPRRRTINDMSSSMPAIPAGVSASDLDNSPAFTKVGSSSTQRPSTSQLVLGISRASRGSLGNELIIPVSNASINNSQGATQSQSPHTDAPTNTTYFNGSAICVPSESLSIGNYSQSRSTAPSATGQSSVIPSVFGISPIPTARAGMGGSTSPHTAPLIAFDKPSDVDHVLGASVSEDTDPHYGISTANNTHTETALNPIPNHQLLLLKSTAGGSLTGSATTVATNSASTNVTTATMSLGDNNKASASASSHGTASNGMPNVGEDRFNLSGENSTDMPIFKVKKGPQASLSQPLNTLTSAGGVTSADDSNSMQHNTLNNNNNNNNTNHLYNSNTNNNAVSILGTDPLSISVVSPSTFVGGATAQALAAEPDLLLSSLVRINWNKIWPDDVMEALCLGSLRTVQNLETLHALGITHILSCGRNLDTPPDFLKVYATPIGGKPKDASGKTVEAPQPRRRRGNTVAAHKPSIAINRMNLNMSLSGNSNPNSSFATAEPPSVSVEPVELDKTGRPRIKQLVLEVDDNESQVLSPYFMQAIEFIEDSARCGGKTLVHCFAGVSRSATVVVAYVMHKQKLGAKEALTFVQKKRPCANPNSNFRNQLTKFETHLREGALVVTSPSK